MSRSGRAPRADARVGAVDAGDVRVDLAAIGAQCGGQRHRRRVAAAAPQRRDVEVVRGALEAGDDHGPPGRKLTLDPRRLDACDARAPEDGVRADPGLHAAEADRVAPQLVQRHREQRRGDRLAGGEEHVQLARARVARDLVRQRDQPVGRVAHRRDDGDHAVAACGAIGDAARDVRDALRVGDGAAAVLLDHQRTARLAQLATALLPYCPFAVSTSAPPVRSAQTRVEASTPRAAAATRIAPAISSKRSVASAAIVGPPPER